MHWLRTKMDSVVRLNERGPRRENPAPIYITNKRTLLQQDHQIRPGRMDPSFWTAARHPHYRVRRDTITPRTEPGTTSRQQAEAFLENQRNPKRRRGLDGEYTEPTTRATLWETVLGIPVTGVSAEVSLPTCITYAICPLFEVPGCDVTAYVSLPTGIHLLVSGRVVEVSFSVSVPGTPSIHHHEESITFYDSSANLIME
jgi:hypothetical protein